jgi:hypothetical protein
MEVKRAVALGQSMPYQARTISIRQYLAAPATNFMHFDADWYVAGLLDLLSDKNPQIAGITMSSLMSHMQWFPRILKSLFSNVRFYDTIETMMPPTEALAFLERAVVNNKGIRRHIIDDDTFLNESIVEVVQKAKFPLVPLMMLQMACQGSAPSDYSRLRISQFKLHDYLRSVYEEINKGAKKADREIYKRWSPHTKELEAFLSFLDAPLVPERTLLEDMSDPTDVMSRIDVDPYLTAASGGFASWTIAALYTFIRVSIARRRISLPPAKTMLGTLAVPFAPVVATFVEHNYKNSPQRWALQKDPLGMPAVYVGTWAALAAGVYVNKYVLFPAALAPMLYKGVEFALQKDVVDVGRTMDVFAKAAANLPQEPQMN